MHTYVALLRGINVGGKHLLPMRELVSLLEGLGFDRVRSHLQSGNLVFRCSNRLGEPTANQIAATIENTRGFAPRILLLEAADYRKLIATNPFPGEDGKALHAYFLERQPQTPDLVRLEQLQRGSERFCLQCGIFFLYAPEGIGRSKLAAAVESALGVAATARNWNTVRRIAAMLDAVE